MGDGCGILVQIPHAFFAAECAALGIELPEAGEYGVGHLFMPRDPEGFRHRRGDRRAGRSPTRACSSSAGATCRSIPATSARACKATEPRHRQIFIGRAKDGCEDQDAFERRLFLARKVISNAVYDLKDPRTAGYYPVCLSSRTIVYKGMVLVAPARRLLPGPAGPALRERARPRPPALRHQHLPDLAARAPLPDGRP